MQGSGKNTVLGPGGERAREVAIFAVFVLLCVAGAVTVLLPETQNDRDDDGAPAEGGVEASTASTPEPAATASPPPAN